MFHEGICDSLERQVLKGMYRKLSLNKFGIPALFVGVGD